MIEAHTITIDYDGIWYDVRVTPSCRPFDFDLRHRDGHYARSFAASVSKSRGWPIVDRTMGGAA